MECGGPRLTCGGIWVRCDTYSVRVKGEGGEHSARAKGDAVVGIFMD